MSAAKVTVRTFDRKYIWPVKVSYEYDDEQTPIITAYGTDVSDAKARVKRKIPRVIKKMREKMNEKIHSFNENTKAKDLEMQHMMQQWQEEMASRNHRISQYKRDNMASIEKLKKLAKR